MLIQKSHVLLFCSVSLMLYSVSATEKVDPNRDDDSAKSKLSQVVENSEMPLGKMPDPGTQYVEGLSIVTSCMTGEPDIPQLKKGVALLTASATRGNQQAREILPLWQYKLGFQLGQSANGLEPKLRIPLLTEALQWVETGSEGGVEVAKDALPKVQFELGCTFAQSSEGLTPGEAVPYLEKTLQLMKASAVGGFLQAQDSLADAYLRLGCQLTNSAEHLPADEQVPIFKQGIDLLRESAKLNNEYNEQLCDAEYNLAIAYVGWSTLDPDNALKHVKEAVSLYTSCAERGHEDAKASLPSWQQVLASLLSDSAEGLSPDQQVPIFREAVEWMKRAAKAEKRYKNQLYTAQNNLADALMNLSNQFAFGEKNPSLREAIPPLREALMILEGIVDDFPEVADNLNVLRCTLAQRLYLHSITLGLTQSIDHLTEARTLIRSCVAVGELKRPINRLLPQIEAFLASQTSKLEN